MQPMTAASPTSRGPEGDVAAAQPRDHRGRRRAERRDRVYQAAVRLFVERGYDNTTMDDIAERADVARGTVFNHYERKIFFVHEWSARRRMLAIDAVTAEHLDDQPVGQILHRYMTELARISQHSRQETVALMGTAVHSTNMMSRPALGRELANYVARGQQRGEIRRTVNCGQAGLLLATGYFAVLTQWIDEEPAPFHLAEHLASMLDIVLGGITATVP